MSIGNQPYLNILQTLNLYSPSNVYGLDNERLNSTISTIGSLALNNSFDFSNTLLSRVLLPNSPLQVIASKELAKSFAVRFAQNLRTNSLPSVSVSGIFNVEINKPLKYWKLDGKDNQTFSDLLKIISGYQRDENPVPFISKDFTYEDSNNFLKKNRGQGQKDEYSNNISRNEYIEEIKEYGKGELTTESFKDGSIPESLLFKTKQMQETNTLDSNGDVGFKVDTVVGNSISPSATVFTYFNDEGAMVRLPKGNGTFRDNNGEKYLRTFTKTNPYNSTKDLMKYNHGTAGPNSVLQTVFPNIAPLKEEVYSKNLMFSIENLAFKGNQIDIKPSETVPNGGRIMWFAPYDIRISENATIGWDKVNFIGRSEPIHTYSGSERNCNISFTLIADYPAELNELKWGSESTKNNDFDKFFMQDNILTKKNLSITEKSKIEVKKIESKPVEKPKPISNVKNLFDSSHPLKYYFDNDSFDMVNPLIQDNDIHTGQKAIDDFNTRLTKLVEFVSSKEGQNYRIVFDASSSALYTKEYNKKLSFLRGRTIYLRVYQSLFASDNTISKYALDEYIATSSVDASPKFSLGQTSNDKFRINSHGEANAQNQNSNAQTIKTDVIDRYVAVFLEYNPKLDQTVKSIKETDVNIAEANTVTQSLATVGDEFYFSRYKRGDDVQLTNFNPEDLKNNLINSYSNNIKYFMPIFHSQTPIDLNERVTFLQQCTKQGNSISDKAANSIFGRPPVCVLRLGDFFHTKILITNISIDYEPLIWDVNPEGIGMQPMIARVNMACIIIGGSSLEGPINKLQNAHTYNYYANTEVYNKTAKAVADNQTIENQIGVKNWVKDNPNLTNTIKLK